MCPEQDVNHVTGYDDDGYRIGANLNGRSVEYTVDANVPLPRVLEEFDSEGNVIARYVYGLGLISRENAAGENTAYTTTNVAAQ